jgi:RND superfamily putative drug exporter
MRTAADLVAGHGAWVVGAWLALAAALWGLVPSVDPARNEAITYLPPEARSQQAVEAIRRHFPKIAGQSEAVVVFERREGPLAPEDLRAIQRVAGRIPAACAGDPPGLNLDGIGVRSPASIRLPQNPLISPAGPQGQAAIVIVEVPANFVTIRSSRVVRHIQAVLAAEPRPGGLEAAVTGSSGYGADYALAAQRSNQRSFVVTIAAVLAILVVIYRAPLAALVPLAAVSLAAAVVLKLLDVFSHWGLHAGTAERTFVFVLLYGAGTDYSLLLVSRYREFLMDLSPHRCAVARALGGTVRPILASGMTNTVGLLTLCTARFRIFQTTGPAVAMAMAVMMLAALSLVPALLAIIGPMVFWPRRVLWLPAGSPACPEARRRRESRFWRGLSVLVTARPLAVLAVCAAVLGVPAVVGARVDWVYDQLTTLAPTYDAIRGKDMALRHWGVGQLGPVSVVLEAREPLDAARWEDISRGLAARLGAVKGVEDIRGPSQPLGKARATGSHPGNSLPERNAWLRSIVDWHRRFFLRMGALPEYVSPDGRAMRMLVVLDAPALTREAMETVRNLRAEAGAFLSSDRNPSPVAAVHLGGATAEMDDVRSITTADFHRIAILVVGLIFLILMALLRRAGTALFMAGCTVLSYLAALGVAQGVFVGLLGADGLDWKVQVFLFVVMVAVGVDYSIFLGARMVEEGRRLSAGAAIRRAVVRTGPVISSCGVIMAATLGSLMTGDLALLHQLGFAMALGMLLDTFLVRPLLIPSFAAFVRRRPGHPSPAPPR